MSQVWIAVFWSLRRRYEEECFPLEEAAAFLDSGEEDDVMFSDSIRCPDGTVYTRDDRGGLSWVDFVRTKATTP